MSFRRFFSTHPSHMMCGLACTGERGLTGAVETSEALTSRVVVVWAYMVRDYEETRFKKRGQEG